MTDQNYRIKIKQGEIEIEVDGDKEFVEKHIEEFKKELPRIAKELPSKEKIVSPEIPEKESELEKLSLVEFYKQKDPKNHNETVVVFAYWLTKKEGKGEFKTKEISNLYSKAGVPKPKNVTQHLKNVSSAKKAYLMKGSKKGLWKLTITGEEFVEKELPRRIEK